MCSEAICCANNDSAMLVSTIIGFAIPVNTLTVTMMIVFHMQTDAHSDSTDRILRILWLQLNIPTSMTLSIVQIIFCLTNANWPRPRIHTPQVLNGEEKI